MSITLIDWLYTDDPIITTPEKQGALIVFPRMLNRWNVASLIVSKWENYKVVIITDYPNEFMETLYNTDDSFLNTKRIHWTDLELIPFPLIKYSDIDSINRSIKNTEIDIIIFDDARMLATIAPALKWDNFSQLEPIVQPKILVLTTWGDTMEQLEVVTSELPGLRLLILDIINDIANVEWKISRVSMSERQLKYYNIIRDRELKYENPDPLTYNIGPIARSYSRTKMLTLYAYPENIMEDTLSHRTVCETDQSTIPDKLIESTWLNPSYINTISDNGPKLQSVLDGVISNWPSKQIIITRFNHRYGVDLITSFFQLMSEDNKNPYELNEIFHTSCTDDYEVIINTLHKFNDSASGILVTNIIPLIPLNDIVIIHIADTYSFLNIKMLLDRCHKRYLNQTGNNLIVCSHVATHPEEKSADEVLYENLTNNIIAANHLYTGLISQGAHIVFNSKIGLIVK